MLELLLVADLKVQQNTATGQPKVWLLELGGGTQSGYPEQLSQLKQAVWDDLVERFPGRTIYTDEPSSVHAAYRDEKYRQAKQIKIVSDPILITSVLEYAYPTDELNNSIFIFATSQDVQRAYRFKQHHKLEQMVVLNANAELYCQDKLAFLKMCNLAGINHPNSRVILPRTFKPADVDAWYAAVPTEGVIIKPVAAALGLGVAHIPQNKQLITNTLHFICDPRKQFPNPCPLNQRFTNYWMDRYYDMTQGQPTLVQAQGQPILVQDRISGVNNKGQDSTYRILFAASIDETTGAIMRFKTFDIIEKLPQDNPIEPSCQFISLTETAAKEANVANFCAQVTDKLLYEMIESEFKKDFTKFAAHLVHVNPSHYWLNDTGNVDEPNPILSYLMPKIERDNCKIYDDNVVQKVKTIIDGGNIDNLTHLRILFMYGYFGKLYPEDPNYHTGSAKKNRRDCPVPEFARTHSLFPLIIEYLHVNRKQAEESMHQLATLCSFAFVGWEQQILSRNYRLSNIGYIYECATDCLAMHNFVRDTLIEVLHANNKQQPLEFITTITEEIIDFMIRRDRQLSLQDLHNMIRYLTRQYNKNVSADKQLVEDVTIVQAQVNIIGTLQKKKNSLLPADTVKEVCYIQRAAEYHLLCISTEAHQQYIKKPIYLDQASLSAPPIFARQPGPYVLIPAPQPEINDIPATQAAMLKMLFN